MSEPDYNDIVYRLRNPNHWLFQIVGPKSGATVHGESDAPREAADEIERLRAELAAATARLENALNEGAKRRAERDALRALLREALAHLKTGQWDVPTDITLLPRINAALNKGDGDE